MLNYFYLAVLSVSSLFARPKKLEVQYISHTLQKMNTSGISIIIVSKGKNKLLDVFTRQARYTNPDSPIIVIGDPGFKPDEKLNINFFNYFEFTNYSRKFAKIYQHVSTNPYDYELFCIQRWFVLDQFAHEYGISSFYFFDADVLIYTDLQKSKILNEFVYEKNTSLLISEISAHSSYFRDVSVLDSLCDFIYSTYERNNCLLKIESDLWNEKYKNKERGGICDMTWLNYFCILLGEKCTNNSIFKDYAINHHVSSPSYLETTKKRGRPIFKINFLIESKEIIPIVKFTKSAAKIKFLTLHFQAGRKNYINYFTTFDCKDIDAIQRRTYKFYRRWFFF